MMELISRNFSDYDFERDVHNRILLAKLNDLDRTILEEIIYSSVKIPIYRLSIHPELFKTLEKFKNSHLIKLENDEIIVDKQLRKYFEFHLQKFEENFTPNLEFILSLLKRVPIHLLPIWYSISKNVDNIFDAIIEKYLITPQIFQRHLENFQSKDKVIQNIIHELFNNDKFEILAEEIKRKLSLSDNEFERYMILFEFNFILCVKYKNIGGYWQEVITPFHEWKQYMEFLTKNPKSLTSEIKPYRIKDFAFVEDMSQIILQIKSKKFRFEDGALMELSKGIGCELSYVHEVLDQLILLNLIHYHNDDLKVSMKADRWLNLSFEEKANDIYHRTSFPSAYYERYIKKAEKILQRALCFSWIYFDDFINALDVSFSDEDIHLKKDARGWRYSLPKYDKEEIQFLEFLIFKKFFQSGIVSIGSSFGKKCFKVTDFGKRFFEN